MHRIADVEHVMRETVKVEPLAYGPDAAARRLGLSVRAIYMLIASGELRSARVGKRRLIADSEIQAFLRRKMNEAAKA
jgi:excisionase family DNA binding protein